MEYDDSFKRLSGNKDRNYTSFSNSKNNSSIVISKRHRRKGSSSSHLYPLVARKQKKNSYQFLQKAVSSIWYFL